MLSPLAYWLVLLAVTLFAFGWGAKDERAASSLCVIASVATLFVYSPAHGAFGHVELGVFLVDLAALAGFVAVAIASLRFWPLWVAGFQLTSVASHVIEAAHWTMIPRVYAAAERLWIYPIFIAIVVGTWRQHRRMQTKRMATTPNLGH